MNGVTDFLLEGRDPTALALSFERGDHSYGELSRATKWVDAHLHHLMCVKGDRVLLIGDNSFFWVACYLGVLHGGLVCVPLSPATASHDLTHIANTTGAKVALLDSRAAARHAESLAGLHVATDQTLGLVEEPNPVVRTSKIEAPRPFIDPADLAALMFTSGSTGTPRGVMVSHGNIMANTTSIIESLQLTAHDRVMSVLPFHYCFGTSLLHTHLRIGGSLVASRFMYVEALLNRIASTACTGFAGVPSHFQLLLRSSGLRQERLPHLRYVQQAGGHLPPAQVDALRAALPRTQVFLMYGQTEATARLSCLPPERLDAQRGSIGKGIPGVRLRVVNDVDQDVRPGEVGEITAEGDNVAQGYWQQPEESAETFRNGRLYTGDLATVDEEGFIYIVGREKDFLKCRGERVSCHAIESRLLELDELTEAAVVGIPDEILGEAVRAFVVARSGEEAHLIERVLDFCKKRMAAHLVPREIVVLPALPKNSAGKVMKSELRRVLQPDP